MDEESRDQGQQLEDTTQAVEPEFRDSVLTLIGKERLLKPKGYERYVHATNRELADQIIQTGLRVRTADGLSSTAVPLNSDLDKSLSEVRFTHNHNPTVVFLTLPNLRPTVMEHVGKGTLPYDFRSELLFTKTQNNDGALIGEALIDEKFIHGYFDKKSNVWKDNPVYWENTLEQTRQAEGWNDQTYQVKRQETVQGIINGALEKLKIAQEKYQSDQSKIEDSLSNSTDGNSLPPIRIP